MNENRGTRFVTKLLPGGNIFAHSNLNDALLATRREFYENGLKSEERLYLIDGECRLVGGKIAKKDSIDRDHIVELNLDKFDEDGKWYSVNFAYLRCPYYEPRSMRTIDKYVLALTYVSRSYGMLKVEEDATQVIIK